MSMTIEERATRIFELRAELNRLQEEQIEAGLKDHDKLLQTCKEMRDRGDRLGAVKLYHSCTRGASLTTSVQTVDSL